MSAVATGRAARYVDRLLKGGNEQPTKSELAINPKALGLTIPPALLQRADQVIE